MKQTLAALSLLALTLPLAACGSDANGTARGSGPTTITVLAAASLTGTFTELADRFEAEHPGTRVKLAFDSSATLAQQALEGAPADVLATADTATMDGAADALATDPRVSPATRWCWSRRGTTRPASPRSPTSGGRTSTTSPASRPHPAARSRPP